MATLRIMFTVLVDNPPKGLTQEALQASVDSFVADHHDGRYPYESEKLEEAACTIVRHSIEQALVRHFRDKYGNRRVLLEQNTQVYRYLADEVTIRRMAKARSYVRLAKLNHSGWSPAGLTSE